MPLSFESIHESLSGYVEQLFRHNEVVRESARDAVARAVDVRYPRDESLLQADKQATADALTDSQRAGQQAAAFIAMHGNDVGTAMQAVQAAHATGTEVLNPDAMAQDAVDLAKYRERKLQQDQQGVPGVYQEVA